MRKQDKISFFCLPIRKEESSLKARRSGFCFWEIINVTNNLHLLIMSTKFSKDLFIV